MKLSKKILTLNRCLTRLILSALLMLFVSSSLAGTNVGVTYQGHVARPTGEAINSGSLTFNLRVLDPSSNCLLWSETQSVNMTGALGNFSLVVGAGTRTDGGSQTLKQVFTNAGALSGLSCGAGSTYSPSANEDRVLSVSFNDGATNVALNPLVVKSVPFAMQADQVSGYGIMNLAKISGAGSATTLTPFQYDFLAAVAAPAVGSSAPCSANDVLKFVGGVWTCSPDLTGGAPGDASYAAKGIVQFNADAATSGVSVAAGVATLNTGIGANQIPKLDASANLGLGIAPTTRLDINGAITQRGMAAPAVSAAGTGRVYFDSTSNKFRVSENTGAYVDLLSGATSLTGDVSGTSSTTSVDKIKGTGVAITAITSGNFLRYNGTNWVNTNLVAADVPALDASKITTGTLGVANGGTGATSIGSGNIVVGAGTGAVTSLASGATGNVIYGSGASSWLSGTPDTAGLVDKTSVQAISGAKTFGATVKMSNQNLLSLGDTGSNAASFKAPATVTSSYTLTMPPALPASNKVLQSDNAGVLSWVTAGGGGDALTTNPLSQFVSTTSAQLAGVLSDETGTGVAVFNTSPTFATNITSPMIVGGTGTTSTLTYKATSGAGAAGADHIFQVGNNGATEAMRILNNGNVGIGTVAPGAKLEVSSGVANTSGLKFTNFTSTAPTGTGQPVGVDASGNLITLASGGGGTVTGVTATAPVVSSGGNAPVISMAASTTAVDGYLKATDFTIFNNKLDSSSAFVGDVSGTSGATSVDKIKGTGVSITALTTGNFLKYNGTNWINTLLVAADIPALDAAKITTGILPVANGGTGAASIGSGNIVVGAGTGAVTSLASGATGNVIYGSGASSWLSGTPDTAGLVDKTSVQAISGAKTFGATVKMSNQNLLSFGDTGANTASIKAPATVTSSYTLTMPPALPASNKVLQSDSAGVLSWVAAGGGGDALTTNPLSQFAATTSAQLAGVLSDETGTGLAVFNTSPTFITNITSPMIVGGTATTSTLTYKATSGVGAVGADHIFQVGNNGATEAMRILNNGNVGIATVSPGEKLEVTGNIRVSGQLSTGSQTITGGTSAIDWNNGNAISTDYNCASNISFANLRDGGTYTLVVSDPGTTQCSFSTTTTGTDAATVTYRFKPTNGARTASTYTIYTLMRVGTIVFVSWDSGF